MYKRFKIILIIFLTVVLFISLSTPIILENVVLSEEETLTIILFVLSVILTIKVVNFTEGQKLREEISTYNSQINTIFNSVTFIMYLKDIKGNVCVANQTYADLLNCPLDKIIGHQTYYYYKDAERTINEDKYVIENKTRIVLEREVESVSGNKNWYRIDKIPVLNNKGKVTHIIVIFKDITGEKKLEQKKDTFVAMLTHDLKTPTIAQIKSLDLLLKDYFGKLTDEQASIVDTIKHSCEYMYNLIYTILDTYKYDSGQFIIKYDSFNIKDLISETVQDLESMYSDRMQTINIKTEITNNIVSADRFQIKRVIMNLLSNAISYGNKDSQIDIFLSQRVDIIELQIKNQSKYITKEQMSDMFKKFKSLSNSRVQSAGTGLGLYLSKKIIDAHNGKIYANSKENGECCFGFLLPYAKNKGAKLIAEYKN